MLIEIFMIDLFHKTSQQCSKLTTKNYSTSFAIAIKFLHKDLRPHIYNIYGFVRFADEIVDSFHNYNKAALLLAFKEETYKAIEEKISLNPILNSFQLTINTYKIEPELIESFFKSMQYDLDKNYYNEALYNQYIYGSAESVGLMCLRIICKGDSLLYAKLKTYACSLGAAFQKVNFLRDMKNDHDQLNRIYFPDCNINFTQQQKTAIENDIQKNFDDAYKGILQLPSSARFGVYVAYQYYFCLFKKIKRLQPKNIFEKRIRIPDYTKLLIVAKASLKHQLNIL